MRPAEAGGEVGPDAGHAAGADGLAAGLLDRLPGGAGVGALGHVGAVDARVVDGEAQRHGVGLAAQDRGLGAGELAGRLGQAGGVAGDHGAVGAEGDLEIADARDRPHGRGQCLLERLVRRRGLVLGSHHFRSVFTNVRFGSVGRGSSEMHFSS